MEPAIEGETPIINPEQSGRDWMKIITLIFVIVVFANVAFLDYLTLQNQNVKEVGTEPTALEWKVENLAKRIDLISSEVGVATPSVETVVIYPTAGPTLPPQIIEKQTVVEKVTTQVPASLVKEFYIPLGQASVKTDNFTWKDTGAEVVLDLSRYFGVKEVTFEATLSAPAGLVEARLYNVSDSYSLADSTLIGKSDKPTLYRSGNLIMPGGSKTYRVQMRTSINQTAMMDNSRIRILID